MPVALDTCAPNAEHVRTRETLRRFEEESRYGCEEIEEGEDVGEKGDHQICKGAQESESHRKEGGAGEEGRKESREKSRKKSGKNGCKAPKAAKPATGASRYDGAGHLDPKYAASLRARSKRDRVRDDDRAFLGGKPRSHDSLAEELGEETVVAMTSGEDNLMDDMEKTIDDERGGPFVPSTGQQEYARGTDASNPPSAKREPFPTT
jgi:hypothetical protein